MISNTTTSVSKAMLSSDDSITINISFKLKISSQRRDEYGRITIQGRLGAIYQAPPNLTG